MVGFQLVGCWVIILGVYLRIYDIHVSYPLLLEKILNSWKFSKIEFDLVDPGFSVFTLVSDPLTTTVHCPPLPPHVKVDFEKRKFCTLDSIIAFQAIPALPSVTSLP